jgi:TusA-related sulfurtransferase
MRLDVRNLEPPQPMIKVAQALESLKEGEVLEVLGSRPFTHLLPRLEELGYAYELREVEEGYLLRIWKRGTEGRLEEVSECSKELEFTIDENTNVGELLKRVPEALDVLIRYGFTPLKNPILRKILPHTVTLGQAKRIRRLSEEKFQELLKELRRLTGQ